MQAPELDAPSTIPTAQCPNTVEATHRRPRVAIVTGAAQGIGRAIALQLALDGLWVAVNDVVSKSEPLLDLVALVEKTGGRAVSVPADVSSENEVRGMVERTAAEFGRVDVVSLHHFVAILWSGRD
jgi:NAD(P)-dependent dehydrogenase (short-subunit alcohol dehydrogenase family)